MKIGDKVRHVRDGVTKLGTIINLLFYPSRTQMSHAIKCAGNEGLKTTKEFIKPDSDEEVADIQMTAAYHMKNCVLMDREQLQRLMHPKALTKQQEE